MLPKKTSLAIITFGVLILLLQAVRIARPFTPSAVLDFRPRQTATVPAEPPRHRTTVPSPKVQINGPNLVDEHGALKAFYQALWRTEAGQPGAVTRILHYGDSPTTADSITADVRVLFQQHFGDAGHGFVLVAKPWAWYGHRGVDLSGRGWHIEAASQSHARDGYHGLGGVSFEGGEGAVSEIRLAETHARLEIEYLVQSNGGVFDVYADAHPIGEVLTNGPDKQPGFATLPLPEGTHHIEIRVQRGPVRLFGVSFEREAPGVIYNSLGLNGGQVQSVVRYFEKTQWTEQLQHQRPDLVVVNYGTNESLYADYIDKYYAGELREVIRRIKNAVPEASVLIMSPMDRGQRDSNGQIVTAPTLPRLVEIQRQTAAEMHCAFFNTFQAMGGEGTMARWYDAQPRLVTSDFMHPFPAGAKKVGVLFYQALDSGFRTFKANQQQTLARRAPVEESEP